MMAVVICERYGWTWEEYQDQPVFFLESIIQRMHAEALQAKKQEQRAGISRVSG